jgi:ABC-type nickel/cobalt efflux system permease component RcnA
VFAVIAAVGSIVFMFVGKRISETETNLGFGVIAYALLYGFVAPFWLVRALADMALGAKRSWR